MDRILGMNISETIDNLAVNTAVQMTEAEYCLCCGYRTVQTNCNIVELRRIFLELVSSRLKFFTNASDKCVFLNCVTDFCNLVVSLLQRQSPTISLLQVQPVRMSKVGSYFIFEQ